MSATTPLNFHFFSNLPPEIRIKIWQYAIAKQPPKILEVYPCRHDSKHQICEESHYHGQDAPRPNDKHHIHPGWGSQLPALASVNTELAYEIERLGAITSQPSNQRRGGHADPEITYFNFELDTLAFRYHDLLRLTGDDSPMSFQGLEKVTKLLILQSWCFFDRHCLRRPIAPLERALVRFPALKELYIELSRGGPRSEFTSGIVLLDLDENLPLALRRERIFKGRKALGISVIDVMKLVYCKIERE